jgi:hypothetical protein
MQAQNPGAGGIDVSRGLALDEGRDVHAWSAYTAGRCHGLVRLPKCSNLTYE